MKLPKFIGWGIISIIIFSCSSPSGSKEKLSNGEFEVTTTGAIEENFSGNATYNLDKFVKYRTQYLHLNLKAGELPLVSDSLSDGYGLFFDIPWDSSGTLELDNRSCIYISKNSFFPYFPYILSYGTINIENQSENLIIGKINIQDTLITPDSGAINITGKFRATVSN